MRPWSRKEGGDFDNLVRLLRRFVDDINGLAQKTDRRN
jgi:hypothetical protein